jgi:hypothetical protein
MPRKTRIDAPGALHHIIVRGIERKKIFYDDGDRNKAVKSALGSFRIPNESKADLTQYFLPAQLQLK